VVSRATALSKFFRRQKPAQAAATAVATLPAETPKQAYRLRTRRLLAIAAPAIGAPIARSWSFKQVDGFGRDGVAGKTAGNPDGRSGAFARGFGGRLARRLRRKPYRPALAAGNYVLFGRGIGLHGNLGSRGVKLGWYR